MGTFFNVTPFLKTGVVVRLERDDTLTLISIETGDYVQIIIKDGSCFDFRFGNEDSDKKYRPSVQGS